jgi:hypothetical protein
MYKNNLNNKITLTKDTQIKYKCRANGSAK